MVRPVLAVLLLLSAAPAFARPRLLLFITVDALGSDNLLRMRPKLKGGLSQLIANGAFFPQARYDYARTVTAAGHSTLVTGANPWRHGIVANATFNRTSGKLEAVFADLDHPILEAPLSATDDVSPVNLIAETLSDRLRISTQGRAKAIAISAKARSAIALAGKLGKAWWFSEAVGKVVTGTYYAKEFPAWVKTFNDRKLAEGYFGKEWALSLANTEYIGDDDRPAEADLFGLGRTFPHPVTGGLPSPGPQYYASLEATPYMNDLLVQLAKAALEGEELGKHGAPDLLLVSFSATDKVYHAFGPFSWEMQDCLLRLDKSIAELLSAAEKAAGGKSNLMVVLTADHGGAALPEELSAAGLPASRLNLASLQKDLEQELTAKLGGGDWVVGIDGLDVYLNPKSSADRHLEPAQVRKLAAEWLSHQSGIASAVPSDRLQKDVWSEGFTRAMKLGYFPERSGDVVLLPTLYTVLSNQGTGTGHGTPYLYDTEVPIAFWGKEIKRGIYPQVISPIDVAPTVAALLEIGTPAMAEGTVRTEVLSR